MKEAGTSKKMPRKFCLLFALTIFPLVLFACNAGNMPAPPTPEGTYAVDPLFREFYNFLGGRDTLGAVISPVYLQDRASYQYTDAALMVYDPEAPAGERFGLASLGLDMNIASLLDPLGLEDAAIDPEFAALYEKLGGESFVGRPITEVRYNPEKRRYEQYFEKVGFYRLEDDPEASVRLLAYGAWKCDLSCRSMAPLNSIIEAPKRTRQKAYEKGEAAIEQAIETGGETPAVLDSPSQFYVYVPYLSKSWDAHSFFLPVMVSGMPAAHPTLPDEPLPASQAREMILQIWESDAVLAMNERQELGVYVIEDGAPLVNASPFLILSLPDGQQHTLTFPPTGPDGQSRLQLEPVDAPNGSLIPYLVCISRPRGENYCVKDDFLIWEENP